MPALLPLTHHQILPLAAPFTRAGLALDLPASDRAARRLYFKPVDHAATADLPALREDWALDLAAPDHATLTRRLTTPDGLQATLVASGGEPAALLATAQAVPVAQLLPVVDGQRLALGLRRGAADSTWHLADAQARAGMLTLRLQVHAGSRRPADIALHAPPGDALQLPDDLLAVLGRRWGRLERHSSVPDGWRSSLWLRGGGGVAGWGANPPLRNADAQAALARAALHLTRTLSDTPARFHQRLVWARWAVAARRTVPLALCIGLIAAALGAPRLGSGDDPVALALMLHAPPLLMIGLFCLRELPRIELPPMPRADRRADWRAAAVTAVARPLSRPPEAGTR